MAKKKLNKTMIVAIVIVVAVIALFFLFKTSDDVSDQESDIVSTRAGLVADEITCLYLGDTPKYGHFAQYSGRVLNEGDSDVTDARIIVEFLDASGDVVGTHETSIVGETIQPGMERPFFSYTEEDTLSSEFESCRAKIE